MTNTPLYFALPNDIFDALYSSQQKFPLTKLKEYAVERGLILSDKLDREEICLKLASLPYSYHQFYELSEVIQPDTKKPRITSQRLETKITANDFQNIFPKFQEKNPHDALSMSSTREGRIKIQTEYTKIDHGQTRLKQRVHQHAEIEVIPDKDGNATIRSTATNHTSELLASLIASLEDDKEEELSILSIDFSELTTTEAINYFFLTVPESITELPYRKATVIKLQRADNITHDEDEDEERTSEALLSTINNATLAGSNILQSSQVIDFLKDGEYYIHTLRWETEEIQLDGDTPAILNIEIKVTPPKDRENFIFDVLNYRNKHGSDYVVKPKSLMTSQKDKYRKLIEKAAFEIFQSITNETSVEQSRVETDQQGAKPSST